MAGLERLLKLYGSIICEGADGSKTVWLWDYANNKARLKTDMTKQEIMSSEKAKWEQFKK